MNANDHSDNHGALLPAMFLVGIAADELAHHRPGAIGLAICVGVVLALGIVSLVISARGRSTGPDASTSGSVSASADPSDAARPRVRRLP